ncbi:MAG: macro domain-containing protein [Coriobacteriia bacterium]|nr:macro domain-containing protein [Coriobacteriia bacterium]
MENYEGQQPVGTSFIIDTGMEGINLIHTPSMINPSRIQDPNVVYECTKSTLEVACENNVQSIVIPAFGGACGGLRPEVIVEKMYTAITSL